MNKNEKGFALVLSLVLLLVMSLMGGSLIVIASGDHSSNNTSDKYQQVFYVAETGLMQGEKWVANNYLGHWIKSGSVPSSSDVITDDTGATDAQIASNEAKRIEYDAITGGYAPYTAVGLTRHTYERGPATNEIEIPSDKKTECMNSFKNIEVNKNLKVAGEKYMDYVENQVEFNFQDNIQHSFLDLISPILQNNAFFMEKDSDYTSDWSDEDVDKILQDEVTFLERFKYEYFIVNVGSASYRGTGSSVAKTSSSDLDATGTAYKVYACGMYYNNIGDTKPDIIVPLESLIVLPS